MSYQQEEKLVRIRVKEGAHENTKVNKDDYRSCLQFDENNGMQGPLDYREVDIGEEIEKYWKDRQPSKVVPTSVDIKHDLIKDEFLSPKVKADLEEIGLMLLEIGVHEWKTKALPKLKEKALTLYDRFFKKRRKDSKGDPCT